MEIFQSEADRLLQLEKRFVSGDPIQFSSTSDFQQIHDLHSPDHRERFLLDLERGVRRRARLKFQTRARRTIVLARLDLNGKAHRNLATYPHRPGERLTGVHVHVYREGLGDRVAFLPEDLAGFKVPERKHDLDWLLAFFDFCHIIEPPAIQTEI
jgi:hypothetical protein